MMALTRSCAMTGISIRRARIDEAAAIAALVRASITELCLMIMAVTATSSTGCWRTRPRTRFATG